MRSPNRRHDVPALYKYLTASVGRIVLASRQLRWSSPALFNDPFDVPREMELGWTSDDLNDAVRDRFRDYLRGDAEPRSPMARVLVSQMKANLAQMPEDMALSFLRTTLSIFGPRTASHANEFLNAWRERLPRMRVLCFSEDPGSPAMWAHYSQAHTGVVLEFESNDERDSPWLLARPVVYRAARPALPPIGNWVRAFLGEEEIDWDVYFDEYEYVKAEEWRYEREHRVVSAAKAGEEGLFSDGVFHQDDLRGVILGANIAPDDEAVIRDLAVRYPQVMLYRGTMNSVTRRIDRTVVRRTT